MKHAFEEEEELPWFLKVVYVSVPVLTTVRSLLPLAWLVRGVFCASS